MALPFNDQGDDKSIFPLPKRPGCKTCKLIKISKRDEAKGEIAFKFSPNFTLYFAEEKKGNDISLKTS